MLLENSLEKLARDTVECICVRNMRDKNTCESYVFLNFRDFVMLFILFCFKRRYFGQIPSINSIHAYSQLASNSIDLPGN
jgi:hypothetical protein